MQQRLTEEEQKVLDKARQWRAYKTPKNQFHLSRAVDELNRAEHAKEKV